MLVFRFPGFEHAGYSCPLPVNPYMILISAHGRVMSYLWEVANTPTFRLTLNFL